MTPQERLASGYEQCQNLILTIPLFLEKASADHIKHLDNRYHELTSSKCMEVAYKFKINDISMPYSWTRNALAGKKISLFYIKKTF